MRRWGMGRCRAGTRRYGGKAVGRYERQRGRLHLLKPPPISYRLTARPPYRLPAALHPYPRRCHPIRGPGIRELLTGPVVHPPVELRVAQHDPHVVARLREGDPLDEDLGVRGPRPLQPPRQLVPPGIVRREDLFPFAVPVEEIGQVIVPELEAHVGLEEEDRIPE